MRLSELLQQAGYSAEPVGEVDPSRVEIGSLTHDSNRIEGQSLFFALPGHHTHGARFVPDACDRGACAVITDDAGSRLLADRTDIGCPVFTIPQVRAAMAHMAAAFYGQPASRMSLLGVTGTNGKTTVTHLVQEALVSAGRACGVIGTLGSRIGGRDIETGGRTTPESTDLQRTLAQMVQMGADSVAMEVSSIAVVEQRVDGIEFDVMGFTGLSHDHLDYHGSMEAYFEAKAQLFEPGRSRTAVVVIDDDWGQRLASRASVPTVTVSTRGESADWSLHRDGSDWTLRGEQAVELKVPVSTQFALANASLAIAMAHLQGVPAQQAADAIASARVPGRMEIVASANGIDFIVDYAHSPDSIEQVVQAALRDRGDSRGRVLVVLGAGGDRDQQKRTAMGRSASSADVVVITDDNPRSEDPAVIRTMIRKGAELGRAQIEEIGDRSAAIHQAVQLANPGDVVLVLGKGHETTQEVAGQFVAFDDREVLASFVRSRFAGVEKEQGGQA